MWCITTAKSMSIITRAMILDDFVLRAVLAGIAVAAVAGPLGSFVVWRRMAYFGDTLSHSALLGVAIGLLAGIDLGLGVIAVCLGVAVLLVALSRRRSVLAGDTLLGILSHGTLALGLIVVGFMGNQGVDLMAVLFGDILAVTGDEVMWTYIAAAIVLAVLVFLWPSLLTVTVDEDLAAAEGVPVGRINLAFMVLIALVVATAMKVVGVLLVAALLIIPAAGARVLSRTPEQMAILAAVIGMISVIGGLMASLYWDTPAGPSIVAAALLLYLLGLAKPALSSPS